MSAAYQPPFTISPEIVSLVAQISEDLGRISAVQRSATSLKLRRINRIRTVHGSLAIEGNTLNEDQISAILDGKLVLAPAKEIQEARNALQAYDKMTAWQPHRVADLLAAHKVLMTGLLDAPGQFRRGGVGIMKGQEVLHMAPPAENVPPLIKDLLGWLEHCKDHPLIVSSVFHYEFEFIHPFADGNGRMGRLWQSLILSKWNPVLAFVPVETLVFRQQAHYYAAINQSTRQADSGPFIEFMLRMLRDALQDFAKMSEKKPEKTSEKILRLVAKDPYVTIAQLAILAGLSTRTIERNIQTLQTQGRLKRVGPDKGGCWEIVQ